MERLRKEQPEALHNEVLKKVWPFVLARFLSFSFFGQGFCCLLFLLALARSFKWFVKTRSNKRKLTGHFVTQYIRAVVGVTLIFTHLSVFGWEVLASISVFTCQPCCPAHFPLLNGNVSILSGCVEDLTEFGHSFSTCWGILIFVFLALSQVHITDPFGAHSVDAPWFRDNFWVGLHSEMHFYSCPVLLTFHAAVGDRVNARILLTVIKSFCTAHSCIWIWTSLWGRLHGWLPPVPRHWLFVAEAFLICESLQQHTPPTLGSQIPRNRELITL